MLSVFGVGEVPISFSGDPADSGKIVHTIRAVGPVSTALTQLQEGAVLGIRGPYGTGWPVDAADGRDIVVIAGGLGLAPVRPALDRPALAQKIHDKRFLRQAIVMNEVLDKPVALRRKRFYKHR